MASDKLDPLNWAIPIVNKDGTPTQEFMRKWKAQRTINNTPDAVVSVNGKVGVVVLNTDDINEGITNEYFTQARSNAAVAALLVAGTNVTLTYDGMAGTLTIDATGGSGSGGVLPLVTGALPGPDLVADSLGQCIGVPI